MGSQVSHTYSSNVALFGNELSDMSNTVFINYLYTLLEEAKSLFVPFLFRRGKSNAKQGRADQIGLGSINQNKIFMVDYIL